TYVIYISDHGDWLGDHGMILKGPMHFEGLIRVPMIVRGPGVPAGRAIYQPVSTIDIGPTLYDFSGVEPMLHQHGASLRPFLEGHAAEREYALNEWELLPTRVGVHLSLRTVRTKTHKMTVDLQSGAGELYDLARDPHELDNLFEDPSASDIRSRLEDYLARRPNDIGPNRVPVGTA
ncbi:MAG: sulfatase/phosphatase domain-containing protein, partial [Pseudomonadota bacterium]